MPESAGPVVVNTGPLSALALLDLLSLLPRFYGEAVFPSAVGRELRQGPGADLRWQRVSAQSALHECSLTRPESARLLTELDDGEAEVLVLAQERNARLVVIDEALGREYASVLGLRVTGTVGVLVRARREGLLPSLAATLSLLKANRYRISETLTQWALREVGE